MLLDIAEQLAVPTSSRDNNFLLIKSLMSETEDNQEGDTSYMSKSVIRVLLIISRSWYNLFENSASLFKSIFLSTMVEEHKSVINRRVSSVSAKTPNHWNTIPQSIHQAYIHELFKWTVNTHLLFLSKVSMDSLHLYTFDFC